MKHKYRKHRTLPTVVAKKTLNVGETLRPDHTLAVCFTTCSRDIYQEILAGQRPTMDTKLQLRSIKVFVRSISEPKTVSLTSSTSVCKSDVGRTDIQRIGPKYPPQCCYSNCNETPTILRLTLLCSQGECSVGWMLQAKIATDVTTVTTLPVLSALNCGTNRKSTRVMTPAKHHSATSPLDVRSSDIAHTALISGAYAAACC